MTLADYSMIAFALLNGGRTAAYFPQMIRIYRDPHGAAAVSLLTWALFALANAATVCYALTVSGDRIMAIVFSLNAVACLAILGLTAFKRLYVARPDIANRISTHREAVSRELSRLASIGLLRREGGDLRVPDLARLETLVREAKGE